MVTREAAVYGLTKDSVVDVEVSGETAVIGGTAYPKKVAGQRRQLEALVARDGFEHTMDAMAYTWFNRFMAIRYMELHGYLEHGFRVLSHPSGDATPEILQHAERVDLQGLDKEAVIDLKLDGTKDTELYRMLIVAQCNALHAALPFLFEKIDDATELLLPKDLLHSESVIRKMVDAIDEEEWQEVEIVGWLYQFYISEKKDEVIGKTVKTEDIPAATQLFTPNWIVKYMLHNSLGAKWLATYPQSALKAKMEYYIEPAEQTEEVSAQLASITPSTLNPEDITLLDPACGSGHILVEAYELFKAIYQERGYRAKDIPRLILEKNLYGLEIDERAAQLASFALLMKARADDRSLFATPVNLNICCIQESNDLDIDDSSLKSLFHNAKTYGSLIRVDEDLGFNLDEAEVEALAAAESDELFVQGGAPAKAMLVRQAKMLAKKYDVVVANPPYVGGKGQNADLKKFLKDRYADVKSDTFSAFIVRDCEFAKADGHLGIMCPFVWMFISSYEDLRTSLIDNSNITSLIQLEYSGFDGATVPICTLTLGNSHVPEYKGGYIKLSNFKGAKNQAPKMLEAVQNRDCGWFYTTRQDDFKKIPGSPIAYWASEDQVAIFEQNSKLGEVAKVVEGTTTGDVNRFLRAWPEVDYLALKFDCVDKNEALGSNAKWLPYNKGGHFRKWFGNNWFVVNWAGNGRDIKDYVGSFVRGEKYHYYPGITWGKVSSSDLSFRSFGSGFLFDTGGLCLFTELDLKQLLGLLNSNSSMSLMSLLAPTLNFTVGTVASLPVILPGDSDSIAEKLIDNSISDWDAYERSWDFQTFPILTVSPEPALTLESSYTAWISQNRETITEMKRLEEENNRLFIDAYGFQDELTPDVPIKQITLTVNPAYRYGGKLTEEEQWTRFRQDTMEELLSYAIGCMMGRYSLDEPGLIYAHIGNDGFDASKYTNFPADDDGILPITDIDWFDDDIANRVVEFISVAWPAEHLEENLSFLADMLGRKSSEGARDAIRRYLSKDFFKKHLQTYKKRPIYWLFSSGKEKAFQCLVYLHRYNEGTLARMRTEYLIPLQSKMNARLSHLDDDIAAASSTSQQKKLEKERTLIKKQQTELATFDEKLRHHADQRIHLDLDDGVKVNYGKFGDLLDGVKNVTGKKAE